VFTEELKLLPPLVIEIPVNAGAPAANASPRIPLLLTVNDEEALEPVPIIPE